MRTADIMHDTSKYFPIFTWTSSWWVWHSIRRWRYIQLFLVHAYALFNAATEGRICFDHLFAVSMFLSTGVLFGLTSRDAVRILSWRRWRVPQHTPLIFSYIRNPNEEQPGCEQDSCQALPILTARLSMQNCRGSTLEMTRRGNGNSFSVRPSAITLLLPCKRYIDYYSACEEMTCCRIHSHNHSSIQSRLHRISYLYTNRHNSHPL